MKSSAIFEGPADLVFATRVIAAAELVAARRRAFFDGRVIEHDHRAVLTHGSAAKIRLRNGINDAAALRDVVSRLRSIAPSERHRQTTAQQTPIALGALAFDPQASGELIVPRVTVVEEPGEVAYVVVVAPTGEIDEALSPLVVADDRTAATEPRADKEAPHRFSLASVRSHADFKRRVADAVRVISEGELEKVVLAREVVVSANQPFQQHQLLERMRVLYPSCAAFAIDGFLGASPELLCRRKDNEATSYPLAGTVPRSGDPDDDIRLANQLLHSAKDRAEHAYVVDMIVEQFDRVADGPVEVDGPHLLELRNVAHLATKVRTRLRSRTLDDSKAPPYPSALELAGILHPTPAVGGVPRDVALSYLDKFEEIDRDRYAGPVGYVDANGDGEWWVGIRSAVVDGETARLFAGVGIMASSDPESELIETQLKFQALLATAVRP